MRASSSSSPVLTLALAAGLVLAPPLAGATEPAPVPVPPTDPATQVAGSVEGMTRGTGIVPGVGGGDGPAVYGTPDAPAGAPSRYVALGDSFASVGRIVPAAWLDGPSSCVRTADAYPPLVARGLGAATFVNATCGGAITDDLLGPNEDGVPPQLDALDAGTDLVTLTIGGNDVGFGAVIDACAIRPNAERAGVLPLVEPMADELAEKFDTRAGCPDVVERQAPAALAALDSRLDEVYAEIHRRSPDARVVAVGYLTAVPDDATLFAEPDCAPLTVVSAEERDGVRRFQEDINRVVAAAAERNGATAVIPDEPGHSMCAPVAERWVDLTGMQTGAAPIHPTSAGHAHVAQRVLGALGG
ncbi:SGNH/GDSL hydrolase family protein [Dietzia sp. 179-F 9C3 NHS]|uniref:SGNH/GDSL hydrolase family protein n=1 Tax=Dietzia sp. 179-F 9C3 NHS TaxID=3374295 RepID=UPI0038797E46